MEAVAGDRRNFVIGQINHLRSVLDDRRRIRGDQELALSYAEDQGTTAPGGDYGVGLINVQHRDPERAAHLA